MEYVHKIALIIRGGRWIFSKDDLPEKYFLKHGFLEIPLVHTVFSSLTKIRFIKTTDLAINLKGRKTILLTGYKSENEEILESRLSEELERSSFWKFQSSCYGARTSQERISAL